MYFEAKQINDMVTRGMVTCGMMPHGIMTIKESHVGGKFPHGLAHVSM